EAFGCTLVEGASFDRHQIRRHVVNVFVCIDPKEVLVGLHRIVQFHFWFGSLTPEGACAAVSLGQSDDEVINAAQTSFHLEAVWPRDGHRYGGHVERTRNHGPSATASIHGRHDPSLLQGPRILDARSDALQIARNGVARCTPGFEVRLTSLWIAHHDARRPHAAWIAARYAEAVDERRDIGNFGA